MRFIPGESDRQRVQECGVFRTMGGVIQLSMGGSTKLQIYGEIVVNICLNKDWYTRFLPKKDGSVENGGLFERYITIC